MERDMSLIRYVLAQVAEKKTFLGTDVIAVPEPYTPEQIDYHAWLCKNAGFLLGTQQSGTRFMAATLTWAGHDKLDELRSA